MNSERRAPGCLPNDIPPPAVLVLLGLLGVVGRLPEHRPGLFEPFEREQQLEWQRLFGQTTGSRATFWAGPELAPCLPASGEDFDALVAELASSAARAQ